MPRRRSSCGRWWWWPACSSVLLVRLLDDGLVGGQRPVPEPLEVGAQRAHPVRVEPVDAAGALGPLGNEPRLLEHPEVLGDGGATDRQLAGELADGARPLGQPLDNRSP